MDCKRYSWQVFWAEHFSKMRSTVRLKFLVRPILRLFQKHVSIDCSLRIKRNNCESFHSLEMHCENIYAIQPIACGNEPKHHLHVWNEFKNLFLSMDELLIKGEKNKQAIVANLHFDQKWWFVCYLHQNDQCSHESILALVVDLLVPYCPHNPWRWAIKIQIFPIDSLVSPKWCASQWENRDHIANHRSSLR